jgi:endonuclease YncB( thermonuclease family)
MQSFIITLMLILPPTNEQQTIVGTVSRVVDGDTVHVISAGTDYTIRLAHIDAPESNQLYGSESTDYLTKLLNKKEVTVKITNKDFFGRHIGNIYLENQDINATIVRTGNAWFYSAFSSRKDLRDAQLQASKNKLGLWAEPVPPWEFRKKKRNEN